MEKIILAALGLFAAARLLLSRKSNGAYRSRSRYAAMISDAAARYRIAPDIIEAILWVESADGTNTNHSLDEIGVMAIRPGTRDIIVRSHRELIGYDSAIPREAIMLAAAHLHDLAFSLKSFEKAIIAYNAGENSARVRVIDWQDDWYLALVKSRMRVLHE